MAVILRKNDMQRLLPMSTAIEVLKAAFRALAVDAYTTNLPRRHVVVRDGALAVMAAAIHELADLVAGRVPPRRPEDITLFRSFGLAIEDVAVASHVYRAALEHGVGEHIAFSGS